MRFWLITYINITNNKTSRQIEIAENYRDSIKQFLAYNPYCLVLSSVVI
jgi:hypothetical protein